MTDQSPANDTYGKLRDGVDTVRDKTGEAYETARAKAAEAVDASRDRVRDVARQTSETIETNPLGVIVGGLALGALVGSLLPRSQREKQLLAPVGRRVGATALAAIAAAKSAGQSELDSLGLTPTAAKGQVKALFDNVVKAASTAGTAAVQAGREKAQKTAATVDQAN